MTRVLKKVALVLLVGSMLSGVACAERNNGTNGDSNEVVIERKYPWFEKDFMLLEMANLVVSGKVSEIKEDIVEDSDGKYPAYIYSIDVTQVYKGEYSGDKGQLKVMQPGGTMDGKLYVCDLNAELKIGTEYLLILEGSPTGYLVLVNPRQSVYNADTGETYERNIFTMEQILKAIQKN